MSLIKKFAILAVLAVVTTAVPMGSSVQGCPLASSSSASPASTPSLKPSSSQVPPASTPTSLTISSSQSSASSKISSLDTSSSQIPPLNAQAQAKGKLWFGSETDSGTPELENEAWMKIFNNSKIFGQTTPGNSMKWSFTQPEADRFTFEKADALVSLAKESNKRLRCHNLVWSAELPSYIENGSWERDSLSAAMKTHITDTIAHFGNDCYCWDVVNEAISSNGSYHENPFLEHIGEDYVPLAFQYASEAVKSNGLDVKLFYNDFGIETPGDKLTHTIDLVNKIRAGGGHIDGIGFESHFGTTDVPSQEGVATAINSFAQMGLEVQLTELDVSCSSVPCTSSDLKSQAQAYYNAIAACIEAQTCTGITVWGFDDQYSWIQPAEHSGHGDGDLFYSNLTPHPALTAASEATLGNSCSVC